MSFSDTYLCGYYGMKNTGDDALLLAASWGAQTHLGAKNFKVSTPERLVANKQVVKPNLVYPQKFRGQNRLNHYKSAFTSRRVIFGGGSVFHNAQDINLKRDMMRLSGGNNHLALGVGIGPFVDSKAEAACKKFLNECSFIGVRDQRSYSLATSLSPRANIRKTFDLAPSLLASPFYTPHTSPRSGIAICLCPLESLNGDIKKEHHRLAAIAETLHSIYSQTKEPITLLDFNGHSSLGDEKVHRELLRFLPTDIPVQHIQYHSNPVTVLNRMGSFKAVISMRLHASVFAYLAETPFISLNYHPKCSGWCNQVGLPKDLQFSTNELDKEALKENLLNGLSNGFSAPSLKIDVAIEKSLMNWSIPNENISRENIRCYSAL